MCVAFLIFLLYSIDVTIKHCISKMVHSVLRALCDIVIVACDEFTYGEGKDERT